MSGKTGETVKRYTMMMAGNLFIGICVGAYRLSAFGVDAFTCMNLGLSQFVGMSFGTWQLLVNVVILGLVFWKARSRIGPGTVVNMVGVGYLADFLCWLFLDVWQVEMTLALRILALLAGSVLSALGVALYITPELGTAPYDSLGLIVEDAAGGRVSFRHRRDGGGYRRGLLPPGGRRAEADPGGGHRLQRPFQRTYDPIFPDPRGGAGHESTLRRAL